jgi:dienelactone hydrolase
MKRYESTCFIILVLIGMPTAFGAAPAGEPLADTQPLELQGDISDAMIAGVDRFLLRKTEESVEHRMEFWKRDVSSTEAYELSVSGNRQRFEKILGLPHDRVKFDDIELVATLSEPALVGRSKRFEVFAVRWPVFPGVHGEGLLLEPVRISARASVVVLPDCEQSPESLVEIVPGKPPKHQVASSLAEAGCRVLIPTLINREHSLSVIANGRRRSTASHREIAYRAAYQMGRHLIGYEVQKVLAAVDWFRHIARGKHPVGVLGYGEGGLIALYAGAVDRRIDVVGVSGYFNSRQNLWDEPIDRNVFGLLREFGDAEIASLIVPRTLVIEACAVPAVRIPPGTDAGPGETTSPDLKSVQREVERARTLVAGLKPEPRIDLIVSEDGSGPPWTPSFVQSVLHHLAIEDPSAGLGRVPVIVRLSHVTPEDRHARQFHELMDYSQRLVDDGPRVRAEFQSKIDRSGDMSKFLASVEPYRAYFRNEIVGLFDDPPLAANPRTRLAYDEPEFRGYEVVLDVFPDVIFYGILLVPKDIKPGERRPVVVCQHGLEGRAQFAVSGDKTSYRDFAARLARLGFVTFAPQHLYRTGDHFRTLQRKANPLKKSLFSVMVAQHRQLLGWLGSLEFVDPKRIGFYGISYGGKSAMRIPAILNGYALSICSSDFSDWIWRTVSNRFDKGYLAHNEYEIFEFGLGSTFNYSDLAALICPRPFMVERFHHDGLVASMDSAEYGRVVLLYENLGISDRTRMSYFGAFQPTSPYEERQTFDFLCEQLKWPRR